MVKILDKITLDFGRDEICGWEMEKDAPVVLNYVTRNLAGDRAPAVEVVFRNGVYQLAHGVDRYSDRDDYNYGGHHRCISSWISGNSLDAFLLEKHREPSRQEFSSIKNIRLALYWGKDIKDFLREAPEDVFSRFVDSCNYRLPLEKKFFLKIIGR